MIDYQLVSLNPYDTFERAQPWRTQIDGWSLVLQDGRLNAASVEHFPSRAAARASLEPLLLAWEAVAYLRDQHEIRFHELDPEKASEPAAQSTGDRERLFRRVNESYPAPDPAFVLGPVAARLVEINMRFENRQADLIGSVRALLAALEESLAKIEADSIAEAYSIDPEVVAKLGELAQRQGTDGEPAFYRGPEWQWLQEALRLVALQAGRRVARPPAARLRLEDFRTRL